MITFLGIDTEGKLFKRLLPLDEIAEVVEDIDNHASIRIKTPPKKNECWIETTESFESIREKIEEAKKALTQR